MTCPDPHGCPVVATPPRLRSTALAEGSAWYRVYDATWGYDEHNPGYGDTRFSPLDNPGSGDRLPSTYLAATPTAALLETVFHDVHQHSGRIIYERDLRGKLLAHVRVPTPAVLADLRDAELKRLDIPREALVSTSAEHYPCTRRLAITALSRSRRRLHGVIWHSRQAELAGHRPAEVVILFGEPRYPTARGFWTLFGPGASPLYDGPGRLLVDEIAESLDALIESET
ncbi:RES domain-containing protein (plasmid) [Mycolicibacterium aichiense]|uniref:RES domain-containing protein n=1 Tax=Mycolicibacterium aichiense TaxID=1799 RepID=UPI003D67257E